MWVHGALCSIPFNLICKLTTSEIKIFRPFDPTPVPGYQRILSKIMLLFVLPHLKIDGVLKDIICTCVVIYAAFPLIGYQT